MLPFLSCLLGDLEPNLNSIIVILFGLIFEKFEVSWFLALIFSLYFTVLLHMVLYLKTLCQLQSHLQKTARSAQVSSFESHNQTTQQQAATSKGSSLPSLCMPVALGWMNDCKVFCFGLFKAECKGGEKQSQRERSSYEYGRAVNLEDNGSQLLRRQHVTLSEGGTNRLAAQPLEVLIIPARLQVFMRSGS